MQDSVISQRRKVRSTDTDPDPQNAVHAQVSPPKKHLQPVLTRQVLGLLSRELRRRTNRTVEELEVLDGDLAVEQGRVEPRLAGRQHHHEVRVGGEL